MKLASLVSATLIVAGLGGSTFAGGFVGLGVSSPSKISLDDGLGSFSSDGRSGKLFGGYSYPLATGRIAAEVAYTGFDAYRNGNQFAGHVLSLAGRYNHRLTDGFEVFGRLGVQQSTMDANTVSFQGTGPVVGGGFEYHPPFKLGVDAAVYVDGNYTSTTLDRADGRGQTSTVDSSDLLFSLGVVVGF
ncbi:MAG: hypothetical protein NT062_36185 [Proteobacteria bacterium]|nr:hypothetical protein [Pseudomonadota bacterium]